MSPNLKFHTPANPQTCTEQTHKSNGVFLDETWRPRPLLSKFLPFATVLRNPWQGLSLTRSRPVSVALVDPAKTYMKLEVYSATIDPSSLPRNWRLTYPFCSCNQEQHSFCATWKCQTRAQLGKRKATSYP